MKNIGIGIIGLGNIGSRLYKEIISNKKDIGLKTNTRISIVAISAKNINKKRSFKVKKKIFSKNPLDIVKNPKVNIVIELIGKSDGISKKIVEKERKKLQRALSVSFRENPLVYCQSRQADLSLLRLRQRWKRVQVSHGNGRPAVSGRGA